ncbi:MAG: neutral zinc metallopeptidase, partial [Gemmatimonadaceae bacterium]|nr:neutral zinc metallopeptidase [Gemmatimonadaceae bacterium]
MRWDAGGPNDDVEDRRGETPSRGGFGLGGGGFPLPIGRLGIGGVLLVLVASYFLGVNPLTLLGGGGGGGSLPVPQAAPASGGPVQETAAERALVGQQSWVIKHAQDFWTGVFQQSGQPYQRAKLVLFRDAVN